jgi:hypothetical protein
MFGNIKTETKTGIIQHIIKSKDGFKYALVQFEGNKTKSRVLINRLKLNENLNSKTKQ